MAEAPAESPAESSSYTLEPPDDGSPGGWFPIAAVSALEGLTEPTPVTVANTKLVVWRTPGPGGVWSVLRDRCPHRSAPLSQGRIDPDSGCLECPYHGWQFEGDGKCTKIPQLEPAGGEKLASGGCDAAALATRVTGDLIWAWVALPSVDARWAAEPQVAFPLLNLDESARVLSRDLPYSVDFLIEVDLAFPCMQLIF